MARTDDDELDRDVEDDRGYLRDRAIDTLLELMADCDDPSIRLAAAQAAIYYYCKG